MWHPWMPTKKELEKWLDSKLPDFAAQENQNPRSSKDRQLHKYMYTEEHEIVFASFTNKLPEWLPKLVDNEPTWKHDHLIPSTP